MCVRNKSMILSEEFDKLRWQPKFKMKILDHFCAALCGNIGSLNNLWKKDMDF